MRTFSGFSFLNIKDLLFFYILISISFYELLTVDCWRRTRHLKPLQTHFFLHYLDVALNYFYATFQSIMYGREKKTI